MMVRRAGYPMDDQTIDVAIEEIETGRYVKLGTHMFGLVSKGWKDFLFDFIVGITSMRTIQEESQHGK